MFAQAHTSMFVEVKREMKARNESLLPDNSSLVSLSCCQPREEQGLENRSNAAANVLYVSLTYQSEGQ